MARSLDGLLHCLVDRIALHGSHGALPSEVSAHVKEYYALDSAFNNRAPSGNDHPGFRPAVPKVDRSCLEQVWKWLVNHPEIKVGRSADHQSLTLSEVETYNASVSHAKRADANAQPFHHRDSEGADSHVVDVDTNSRGDIDNRHGEDIDSHDAPESFASDPVDAIQRNSDVVRSVNSPPDKALLEVLSKATKDSAPGKTSENHASLAIQPSFQRRIRLYAKQTRLWLSLTGHGYEPTKILKLDFQCLLIIAASGPKGMDQQALIEASGQDKRSVPLRTDRLSNDGYIKKRPVFIQSRISNRPANTSHLVLKRFVDEGIDEPFEDDFLNRDVPISLQRRRKRQGNFKNKQQEQQALDKSANEPADASKSPLEPQPIPQWISYRCLGNQIFNIVERSGTKGIDMNSIRDILVGEHVRKPALEYIGRLVECWQLSQPLHLRHLAIVRDTALKGKINCYMHYTVENFRKRAEQGIAFWEPVLVVPAGVVKPNNVASSLNAESALDKDGFPALDSAVFEGEYSDATPAECVMPFAETQMKHFRTYKNDPIMAKQPDGTNGIVYGYASGAKKVNLSRDSLGVKDVPGTTIHRSSPSKPKPHRQLGVKQRGRPRQSPVTASAEDLERMDPNERLRVRRSMFAADKYARNKLEDEITYRVNGGGDTIKVTHEVLAEAEALGTKEGQRPLSAYTRDLLLHKFGGGPKPRPLSPEVRGYVPHPTRPKFRRRKAPLYSPSMAAHTLFVPKGPEKASSIIGTTIQPASNANTGSKRARRMPNHLQNNVLMDDLEEAIFGPAKKKRQRATRTIGDAAVHHQPSGTAHSWRYMPMVFMKDGPAHGDTQENIGLQAQSPDCSPMLPIHQMFSGTAAHNVSTEIAPTLALVEPFMPPIENACGKGVESPNEDPRFPRAPGHNKSAQRTPIASTGPEMSDAPQAPVIKADDEGLYPGWKKYMLKYYQAELGAISRPMNGLYLGETKTRRKRGCEPVGYRPRLFKVVIFKSERLRELNWSQPEFRPLLKPSPLIRDQNRSSTTIVGPHTMEEVQSLPCAFPEQSEQPHSLSQTPSLISPANSSVDSSHLEPILATPRTSQERNSPTSVTTVPSLSLQQLPPNYRLTPRIPYFQPPTSLTNLEIKSPAGYVSPYSTVMQSQTEANTHLDRRSTSAIQSAAASPRICNTGLQNPVPIRTDLASAVSLQTESGSSKAILLPVERETQPTHTQSESNPTTQERYPSGHASSSDISGRFLRLQAQQNADSDLSNMAGLASRDKEVTCDADAENNSSSNVDMGDASRQSPVLIESHLQGAHDQTIVSQSTGSQLVQILAESCKENTPRAPSNSSNCAPTSDNVTSASNLRILGEGLLEANRMNLDVGIHGPHVESRLLKKDHTSFGQDAAGKELTSSVGLSHGVSGTMLHHNSEQNEASALVTSPKEKPRGQPKPRSVARNTYGKLDRKGGSAALLRRKIVMQLVEKCDGVFPGPAEMIKPFYVEWAKIDQEGTPEEKTIENAIAALCGEGKLRQLNFTFQNRQSKLIKKSMVMLASIEPLNPKVKDIQDNMIAWWPRLFIPDAVTPTEGFSADYRPRIGRYGEFQGDKIVVGKASAAHQRLAALKEQEPDYALKTLYNNPSASSPDDTLSSASLLGYEASRVVRVPDIDRNVSSQQQSRNTRRPKHSAARRNGHFASRKRRKLFQSVGAEPPLPLPDKSLGQTNELVWLPEEYAFEEFNFEDARPTLLKSTTLAMKGRPDTEYGEILNLDEEQIGKDQSLKQKVDRLIRHVAQVVLESEQREAGEEGDQIESQYRSIDPSLLYLSAKRGNLRIPKRRRIHDQMITSDNDYHTPKRYLVSTMDPIHVFHQTTGTFSVTFSGLSPPRPIVKNLGTCSRPYSHGPRIFHSASDFPSPKRLGEQRFIDVSDTIFGQRVEEALSWELQTEDLGNVHFDDFPFVNHTLPHTLVTAESTAIEMHRSRKGGFSRMFRTTKPVKQRISNRRLNYERDHITSAAAEALEVTEAGATLKRRRLTSLAHDTPRRRRKGAKLIDENGHLAKISRIRGPYDSRSLSESEEKRLITAVVVVRTLTGGLDKSIDWLLAAKAFGNSHTQLTIHGKWNYVRGKYKSAIPKVQSEFEDAFIKAYEEGSVPALDFDNLTEYNWKWLTDWAMALSSSHMAFCLTPDLPFDEAQLNTLYDPNYTEQMDINPYFDINVPPMNISQRTRMINHTAYVCHLSPPQEKPAPSNDEEVEIVKTWVRANIITPDESYNSSAARDKFASVSENIIEDALRGLLSDRVIIQENKGRLIPGRNYDISNEFINRLEKNISLDQLRRAHAHKCQLDEEFGKGNVVRWLPTSHTGEVLAMMNLSAQQQIKCTPIDNPANKWGHTDGHYMTRQMDKSRLIFSIDIRPTPNYIRGNPLEPFPEPPSQHLADSAGRIPLWYDIHGSFVSLYWDLGLAAVLALLAVRPGLEARGIEQTVQPAMQAWEIQMILEWCVHARVAEKIGHGFKTTAWWWLALPKHTKEEERLGTVRGICGSDTTPKSKGKEREMIGPTSPRAMEENSIELD